MKIVHGFAFPDDDRFMSGEIQPDGGYQATHLTAALRYVTDWGCALDGGAHVGTWSRSLAARFTRVIAVEPSADTFEALVRNLQTFACTNVEAVQAAIGAAAGTVSMQLDGRAATLGNTGARYVQIGGEVPLRTIDSWALPSLGFLKLDVEGSEYAALQGARGTLTRCRPVVLFENKYLWRRYGVPRDGPASVLASLGYRCRETVSKDEIWTWGR